jgi:hypothetical protein
MTLGEQVPEFARLPKVQCSAEGFAGEVAVAACAAAVAAALPLLAAAGGAGLGDPFRLNREKLVSVGPVADARLLVTIASPRGLRMLPPPPKDAKGVGLPMLLDRRIWPPLLPPPGVWVWWLLPALPSTPPRERMLVRREGCVPDLRDGDETGRQGEQGGEQVRYLQN